MRKTAIDNCKSRVVPNTYKNSSDHFDCKTKREQNSKKSRMPIQPNTLSSFSSYTCMGQMTFYYMFPSVSNQHAFFYCNFQNTFVWVVFDLICSTLSVR